VIRIAVTAVLYRQFNRPVQTVHDWAGLAMMVLAIFIVMLELMIMDWVIIEEAAVDNSRTIIRATYGPDPGPR
jgi:hypothetical protein